MRNKLDFSEMMKNVSQDELGRDVREIVDVIGIQSTMKLCDQFGGSCIYLPKGQKIRNTIVKNAVMAELDGYNIKALSKKYGLCERTVQKYNKERKEKA